jgi:hypothetical protein
MEGKICFSAELLVLSIMELGTVWKIRTTGEGIVLPRLSPLRFQVFWVVTLTAGLVIPDVSKERAAFMFRGQGALGDHVLLKFLDPVPKKLPSCMELHISSPVVHSGPLTYELNSFARAGRNSSWSQVKTLYFPLEIMEIPIMRSEPPKAPLT